MKIFITGGAGFIGSHLTDLLLSEGHSVVALDNLSTGTLDNIKHLDGNPNYQLIVGDVSDPTTVARAMAGSDQCYHLAAAVGVNLIVQSPVHTIETNVHGTEVVLSEAEKTKTPVLIASTSEVYGKSTDLPFHEEGSLVMGATTKGRWAYACSKALDEFLGIAYWKEKELPVVVVRFFNTVGPKQTGRYGMVIPRFVKQALANEAITVYGDGLQSRCFGNVSDVVNALPKLMGKPECRGQVYNLGSSEEITILDLAKRVIERAGSESSIVHVPYEEAYEEGFEDMRKRVPNTEKAAKAVGFQATKSLNQTLDEVIGFYREMNRE